MHTEKEYQYWLANLAKSDSALTRHLIGAFHTAEQVYGRTAEELLAEGFNIEETDRVLRHREEWDLTTKYEAFRELGIGLVTLEEALYPEPLRQVHDCPYALYYLGTLPADYSRCIAMVGSRRCSGYGTWATEEMAYQLGARGYTIVSGMAKGIDGAAHHGCLKADGYTVAVLGCGVDYCYPAENRALYDRIAERGCLLSEFPPGTEPMKELFPQRNRIISALSQKVLVMEARRRSGSLITADFALEQGRELYALPGRINDEYSIGTNYLIYQGATPIHSIEGFLKDLDELDGNIKEYERLHRLEKFHLEKAETLVYSYVDFYPTELEDVVEKSGLPLTTVFSAVEKLQRLSLIRECFHNQYIRTQ